MTDASATGARRKPLRLAMEIDAPATPRHVVEAAHLFADALQAIAPELGDDDVTLVVSNRELRSELRGYSQSGRAAVGSLTGLFVDPEAAVRSNRGLFNAAAVVAKRLVPLIRYSPRIYRGEGKKPIVTLTSFYSQRIAAMSMANAAEDHDMAGGITGETVIHVPILRFGRSSESATPKATIRLFGKLIEAEVSPHLAHECGQLVDRGEAVSVRLRGRWLPSGDGSLELRDPIICALDSSARPWSGSDFIEDVRTNSETFSGENLERIRDGLRNLRE